MDEQTARDNALTRIALGHAANSKRFQHEKSREKNLNSRKKSDLQNHRHLKSSDESAHVANPSHRKIICYNCGKEGHIAPDCKAPKKDRNQQANTAQEKQGNEIACSTVDVLMEDTDIDSIVLTANHDGATEEVSNMLFIEDAGFHFNLLNHLFVSMYFEAFDFFTNSEDAIVPDILCCVHNKLLSELHLGFAKIIRIALTKDKDEIWQMLEHDMLQVIKAVFNVNPIG